MAKNNSSESNVPLAGFRVSSNDTWPLLARSFRLRTASPLFRLLAVSMVLLLLAMRLGSFTEEIFVTPVEDAIFDVAFIGDSDHNLPTKVIKSQRSLDCDLPSGELSAPPQILILAVLPEHVPALFSDENPREIFIPPEGFSWPLFRA